MVNVNDFKGLTDSDIIENAIKNKTNDGIVVISPRESEVEPNRNYWLIDRAILLPENTTVILQNCMIKLSDKCRDNFFRTANCGMGIEYPEKIKNVHLIGEGKCVLQGADHPRAVGDRTKTISCPCPYEIDDLCKMADWIPAERRTADKIEFMDRHSHSYGTDTGKEGESQCGDWRGIGVLFANVEDFSIENITIKDSHGWGISLEECSNGYISKINFDTCMSKEIDGMLHNMENQDGIDLRNGCHHITITDITGRTGDDVIALTAIAGNEYRPGGTTKNTHVMHNDWTKREKDIHDIIIRNVSAYSNLCWVIRLLPANTKIWNVVIDGIIDNSPDDIVSHTLLLGKEDGAYGVNHPDSMQNIIISNVVCNSDVGIIVDGYLSDSIISNVINRKKGGGILKVARENGLKNVAISNLITN